MQPGKAFLGGVLGGAVMTLLMALARAIGMPVNMSMWLGSMITLTVGPGTWILGFLMHLFISGLIGLAYGAAFEYVTRGAGAGNGLLIAIPHLLIGGVLLGFLPAMHPLMPSVLLPPGAFLAALGIWGVVAFVAVHLVYGAIVGGTYAPVLLEHRRHAEV